MKYQSELKLLDRILNFALDDLVKKEISFKLYHSHAFYYIVIASYIKAYKTTKSISMLLKNGFASDAQVLLRILIENFINLVYISRDPNRRSEMYFDSYLIWNKKMINILMNNKDLKKIGAKIPLENREQIDKQYEEIIRKRKAKLKIPLWKKIFGFTKKYNFKTWSGYSTEKMAKEVGLESFYDLPYRLASEVVHGQDLYRHLKFVDNENFDILKGLIPILYDDEMMGATLKTTIFTFYLFLKETYNLLSKNEEIDKLKKEFYHDINSLMNSN